MIISFKNKLAEALFVGIRTKETLRFPPRLLKAAQIRLDYLHRAKNVMDLLVPPGNQLEKLSGDRKDQYSIRINNQWRICFRWTEEGPAQVEIVDYH